MSSPNERRQHRKQQRPQIEQAAPQPSLKPGLLQNNALLICLSLAAISLVVYSRSLLNGFVNYDDPVYITANEHVRSGLTGETVRWAFTTDTAGNWHPLSWISHAFDVQMFGLTPVGHHFNSVSFHTLNAVLLFLLLWKATGAKRRSFAVAAFFAVHPLNVECVAWAAERKSLLSTMLFLLALGAYGWYAKRPSLARYGVLAFLFALGLMAKPMVITLPFVLLLLDYWPLRRVDVWTSPREPWVTSRKTATSLLLEKVPLLLLAVASAVATMVAQFRANAVMPLSATPVFLRIENSVCSYALYLLKTLWPVRLAVFYPETAVSLWQTAASLLLLCGISIWVWQERKQRPYLLTGWLWFLGTLVPVIGLVQVGSQAMADRYAYIPLIGVFVMLVWRLAETADFLTYRLWPRLAVAIVLLGLASLTWRQVGFWQNPISLWTHTLQVTRDNIVAEDNLGSALIDLGRDEEAIIHFRNAIHLKPTEPKAHIILGALLQKNGEPREAIEQYKVALPETSDPDDLLAIYTNLGAAFRQTGNYTAASDSFQQVLQRDPSNIAAMMASGNITLLRAAEHLAQDVDRHPTATGYSQLGSLWEQAGKVDRAKQAYQSALALNGKLRSAQSGLERLTKNGH
jgi:tetratricopeptide (TPR) repeat protein